MLTLVLVLASTLMIAFARRIMIFAVRVVFYGTRKLATPHGSLPRSLSTHGRGRPVGYSRKQEVFKRLWNFPRALLIEILTSLAWIWDAAEDFCRACDPDADNVDGSDEARSDRQRRHVFREHYSRRGRLEAWISRLQQCRD